jgi:hypothetical protein
VVSGSSVVSVPVGVCVGSVKSCVVGVFVGVLEGSLSGEGVIVVVGDVSLVALETGDGAVEAEVGGSGVTEAVGEGVGVRHGPCVARLRYCGHSLSFIFIWRRPPGRLSQIVKVCVPSLLAGWLLWFWFGGDVGLGVDVEGFDIEAEADDNAVTEEIIVGVVDGEGVAGSGAIDGDGEGNGATVGDDDATAVGEKVADAVNVGVGV